MLRHSARIRGGEKGVHARENVLYLPFEGRKHFVLGFFRIIQHGFQPGDDVAERVGKRGYIAAERAVHEPVRRTERRRTLGVDHVRDALGVRKRKSAGKICQARKLSSFGESCSGAESRVKRAAHDANPSVEIKLDCVLSRVRLGGREKDRVAAVAEIAGVKRAEAHIKRRRRKRTGRTARANENGIGDRERVLAGHAQDPDTTCPYGR